jgi:serine phosphatase RsbU (regulator of sigma subunit)
VEAALLATLLVGRLRNGRRRGLDIGAQAAYANDSLAENAPPGRFVTGQLLDIDLPTGTARVVNAGHTLPLRLRGGRVEEVDLRVEAPFGVLPGKSFEVQAFPLLPGDRLVFLTDGMLVRLQHAFGRPFAKPDDVRAAVRRHPQSPWRALLEELLRQEVDDVRLRGRQAKRRLRPAQRRA